ncbi:hypothetical protein HK102_009266, partial [Quaeritorhiza haematococci]
GNLMYVKVTGPGSNFWFFTLDPNVGNPCRDMRPFDRLEFDISIPSTATKRDFLITLTQKLPDCTTRGIDSTYLSAAKYASGGLTTSAWQTVSIPFADFATNVQGGAYDFEHFKDITFVDLPRFTSSGDAVYIDGIRLVGKKDTCGGVTPSPSPTASPTPSPTPTSGCTPTTLTVDDFSATRAGNANLVGGQNGASSNVAFSVSSGRMNFRATATGSNYWFSTLSSGFCRDLTPFTHLEFDAFLPTSTSYSITLVQGNSACTARDSGATDATYQVVSNPAFTVGTNANGSRQIRIPLSAFGTN